MALRMYALDMLSGAITTPLPFKTASWKITTNADGSTTCVVPARDPQIRRLNLWQSSPLAKTGLAAVVDGIPTEAGPIWKRSYDAAAGTITFTGGGLWSYWNKRVALPAAAATTPLVSATGVAATALNTTTNDVSLGTIGKRYVQLAQAWPNGSIPMVFPADETSTGTTRTVAAVDLKYIGSLITDLSNVIGGPDFAFRPRWNAAGTGIYWEMQYGTVAQPRLGATDPSLAQWSVEGPNSAAYALKVDEDGTGMATAGWATGTNANNTVLAASSSGATLLGLGYPALDETTTGLSNITQQSTMQGYADQIVALGRYVSNAWSMSVRASQKGAPRLDADYWLGSMSTINVHPNSPVIPPGAYVRRIASISGDQDNHFYSLSFAEALS